MKLILTTSIFLSIALATNLKADEKLKIISLTPIITEIISELNQEELLVGKTAFCTLKNRNLKVPSVGSYLDTSIEGIISLKPDIVFMSKEQNSTADKLKKLGIESVLVSNQTIEEINQAILLISKILKVPELGVNLAKKKRAEIAGIKRKCVTDKKTNGAIFIFDEGNSEDRKKYFIASQNSFFNEILILSNLKNLFESKQEYAEVSIEGIYSLKPEVIFLVTETKDPERTLMYLKDVLKLQATQKIVLLPKEPTIFPGPRYPEILKSFACYGENEIPLNNGS